MANLSISLTFFIKEWTILSKTLDKVTKPPLNLD
jgi:hypothetical protein